MKLNKSLLVAAALLSGMLTSCSDSGYWEQASSAELGNGETYSFNNSTASYTFEGTDQLKDTDINVTITRGTKSGKVTIPVKVAMTDPSVISTPAEVTFEDGSNTALFPIHFKEELVPGVNQQVRLTLDPENFGFEEVEEPEPLTKQSTHEDSVAYEIQSVAYATYQNRLKNYKLTTVVTFSKTLTWKEAGKCLFVDYVWASSGASADDVTILNAVGTNMYRIVAPYQAIYSADPAAGFDTDTGFTFYLNDDLSIEFDEEIGAVGCPGESSYQTYQFVWGVGQFAGYASYCSVTRDENIYDVRCLRLLNKSNLYTGHFAFMWTEGWPGAK